jgi:hypothetical protein
VQSVDAASGDPSCLADSTRTREDVGILSLDRASGNGTILVGEDALVFDVEKAQNPPGPAGAPGRAAHDAAGRQGAMAVHHFKSSCTMST